MSDQQDNSKLPDRQPNWVMTPEEFRSIVKKAGPKPPEGWSPTPPISPDDPRHGSPDSPARQTPTRE